MTTDTHAGYPLKQFHCPVKRYCQTLNLKENPDVIAEYRRMHSPGHIWPEIIAGIRQVGILEMEIYISGFTLFMIIETPLDFNWDEAMARLNTLPRQTEWEEYILASRTSHRGSPHPANGTLWSGCFIFIEIPVYAH